jgi:hypothetical protein
MESMGNVFPGFYTKAETAVTLNVSTQTVDKYARSGQLPRHECKGRTVFKIEDVEQLGRPVPALAGSGRPKRMEAGQLTQEADAVPTPAESQDPLKDVAEVLAPPVSPQAPVLPETQTLGRLPKNRQQVFRLRPDGARQLIRERFIEPAPTTEKDKPAEAEKKEEKN